jgi:hypothetical protein
MGSCAPPIRPALRPTCAMAASLLFSYCSTYEVEASRKAICCAPGMRTIMMALGCDSAVVSAPR